MQLSVWQLHPGSADRLAVGPKSRNAGTDRVRKAPSKSPFSRATRAVAVLLVACAALFANAPAAQAQTSTEVWSATLTVGTNGDAPYIFYGWNDFNSYAGASLSDQDFTFEGKSYNLDTLRAKSWPANSGVMAGLRAPGRRSANDQRVAEDLG